LQSGEQFEAIIDSAMDAIITVDEAQRIVLFNPAAEKMMGCLASEALGQPLNRFIPQRFRAGHAEQVQNFGRSGETRRQIGKQETLSALRADGTELPAEISISQVEIDGRKLFTAIVRDISERQRATETLAKNLEELARSNRDLEQFAYVASHDLQEPLRMVASYTQLLAERYRGQLDETADKYIGYAVEGAQRMQTLVQDLLNFSRVGRNGRQRNSTNANAALDTALLNFQAAIKENGAEITHTELPLVLSDHLQLVQLFQNLIGNAIKFRSHETPRVSISAENAGADCRFTVRDNGVGIAPEHAESIFMIFHRLHTRAEYPGNGIGLAICKKIVEQHGGKIWVEPHPGQGSTFKFMLPACAADESSSLEKEVPQHAAASA
jgi:PAS domain S-box-containing protein